MTKKKMPKHPWYTEGAGFFGPSYLKEYAKILTPERTKNEVDFLVRTLGIKRGSKILDCPCGHGRHSIELASRGYKVTSQDINTFFLRKAKEIAKRASVSVKWITGDMRDIKFENYFDVALNLFTSFGYLENEDEDLKVIKQASKCLRTGGKFVLDVINRDRIISSFKKLDWCILNDQSIIVSKRKYDIVRGLNIEERIRIDKKGKRKTVNIIHRLYTIPELISMFNNSDLAVNGLYGNYNGGPITLTSKRYILIAEKK